VLSEGPEDRAFPILRVRAFDARDRCFGRTDAGQVRPFSVLVHLRWELAWLFLILASRTRATSMAHTKIPLLTRPKDDGKRTFSVALIALVGLSTVHAQLDLDGSISPAQLVQHTLLGTGVTVSNVTYNGLPGNTPFESIGRFDGSDCVLGIDSGIVMCTGGINVAQGPNNSGSMQMELSDVTPSDDDLENVAGDLCMDVATLEFDFVPQGDSITFAYSFASEEYLEYVNAGYNDAFGFFLSGPGIFGPFQNGAVNLAVVPGNFSYVSVNSVNTGSNSQYYQDNGSGSSAPYNTNPYYIQFDGFTVGLRAGAVVQCGQTYHIKMAIGDVGDPNWDSGVFIQGGTFSSTGGLSVSISTPAMDGTIAEGCGQAIVTLTRSTSTGELVIPLSTVGSATIGVDFSPLPASITIPEGQASASFVIDIPNDDLTELDETLIIQALFTGACGDAPVSAQLIIHDHPPLVVTGQEVNTTCSDALTTIAPVVSGGIGPLGYVWNDGSADSTLNVPGHSGVYYVTITDACGLVAEAGINVFAPCEVVVPNVFTPNSDGENDRFVVEGLEGTRNTVEVFNRWGQLVYQASNYANNWEAHGLSDGTYYYVIKVEGYSSAFTGHVTILANRS